MYIENRNHEDKLYTQGYVTALMYIMYQIKIIFNDWLYQFFARVPCIFDYNFKGITISFKYQKCKHVVHKSNLNYSSCAAVQFI